VATFFHNITTTLTKDLLTVGEGVSNLKYISIANVDSKSTVINLFLNKASDNYYITKGYRLTPGSTLYLKEENNIAFNNGASGYSMRIKVQSDTGAAVSVDVILKRGA